jgi:hypothetical protein
MLPNCQYNLATTDRQIVSKNLAISVLLDQKQHFSDKRSKIASNQNDA